jgi:hypothetical protein
VEHYGYFTGFVNPITHRTIPHRYNRSFMEKALTFWVEGRKIWRKYQDACKTAEK